MPLAATDKPAAETRFQNKSEVLLFQIMFVAYQTITQPI
jgi:hypothetical protein